jgi:Putative Ig domain
VRRLASALIVVAGLSVDVADANLIQTTPVLSSGSGIGGVNTVLTEQGAPTESGCVAWNGAADVIGAAACPPGVPGGNESTGASQTQTRTLAQLAIANAAGLRIVVNTNEPGGNPITLTQLVLRIYDGATGAVLFTSSLSAPITFTFTNTGGGTSGFVFLMDAADAAAAQGFFANPANRIGLAASFSDAAGGGETLYVVNAGVITLCPVITTAPASLPNGTVGVPYSQQITASGGAAPYTFTLVSGALPGGLAVGPSGLLAGVPAAGTEGTYSFRVRATDTSGCTSDRDYVLIIAAAVPVLPPGLLLVMALLLLAAGALVMRRRGVA